VLVSAPTVIPAVMTKLPQLPQAQYSLDQQLRELVVAANRLGLYDAAQFITDRLEKT
jgi:hypothetical protein